MSFFDKFIIALVVGAAQRFLFTSSQISKNALAGMLFFAFCSEV
jgi:hypothetical protein